MVTWTVTFSGSVEVQAETYDGAVRAALKCCDMEQFAIAVPKDSPLCEMCAERPAVSDEFGLDLCEECGVEDD